MTTDICYSRLDVRSPDWRQNYHQDLWGFFFWRYDSSPSTSSACYRLRSVSLSFLFGDDDISIVHSEIIFHVEHFFAPICIQEEKDKIDNIWSVLALLVSPPPPPPPPLPHPLSPLTHTLSLSLSFFSPLWKDAKWGIISFPVWSTKIQLRTAASRL